MPTKKSSKGLYDWGDGKGKIHNIPKNIHAQNVEAKGYGIDLNAPASTPLTTRQSYGLAQQDADLQYNPQIQAATQMGQTNAPAWYQNYVTRATEAQTAATKYAQPVLQQANAWANQPAQAAPGLDSSSPYAAQSQQAAQSGSGLAKLGADVLGAVQNTTTNYLGSQQAIAARDLPQAQAYYAQEAGRLRGERGQAVAANYAAGRTQEQNAQIAYDTLGLNTKKARADVDLGRGVDPITGKPLPADPEKPYTSGPFSGYTPSQVRTKSTGWKDRKKDEYATRQHDDTGGATKEQEKKDKETAKKKAAVQKATGKVRVDVDNTISAWRSYVGQTTDDTSKPKDPVTGEYPPRKVTPSDIKRILGSKGYDAGMIHVALMVGAGKPLDAAAINYLHSKDPNLRIPREWINGKKKPAPTGRAPLADDGNGQQRPT